MNVFLNIKLIARNWWRNKLFFLISLFSLTAGLGCTNLLMTFFIHEYNVEKYNTDRNLIYLLRQDSPMEEGIKRSLLYLRRSHTDKENMLKLQIFCV